MAKPPTKVTFVRLPLDYYREVMRLTKEEDRSSMANMLTVLVKEAVDARKRKD